LDQLPGSPRPHDSHRTKPRNGKSGCAVRLPGGSHKLTGYLDIFNALNSNPPMTFRTATASNGSFKEVTVLLDPRIVRFGVRYEF
jgi:hypothetical protein